MKLSIREQEDVLWPWRPQCCDKTTVLTAGKLHRNCVMRKLSGDFLMNSGTIVQSIHISYSRNGCLLRSMQYLSGHFRRAYIRPEEYLVKKNMGCFDKKSDGHWKILVMLDNVNGL